MIAFKASGYETLNKCPWCNSPSFVKWGAEVRGFASALCEDCGLIFVKNRLDLKSLSKYYENYLTEVHQVAPELNEQRDKMYELEFSLVDKYCNVKGNVLDVGCSGGYFLDCFNNNGYGCYGVEFGNEAAKKASEKYKIYKGDFANLDIDHKFDLIVFRGVLEHVSYPKSYLNKAQSLLNDNGLIYITSTPNSGSICCRLFKEQWNQHVPECHLMHFKVKLFDEYFNNSGYEKLLQYFFYEETPYADPEKDILKVAEAIKIIRQTGKIAHAMPSFYGNLMTLIYRKGVKAVL